MSHRLLWLCLGTVLVAAMAFGAVADGTWVSVGAQSGSAPTNLVLQQNGNTLTGTANGLQISNGKVERNFINFVVVKNGTSFGYKGTINGDTLDLHQSVTGDGSQSAQVTLSRRQ